MSKYSKMSKVAKVGAVDSKYFRNLEQFDIDVQAKIDKAEQFKNQIKELILQDPNLIEQIINNTVKLLLDLKKEYGL